MSCKPVPRYWDKSGIFLKRANASFRQSPVGAETGSFGAELNCKLERVGDKVGDGAA